MLHVTIPSVESELYDQSKNEFITIKIKSQDLQLEHSLVSVSKWEAKYKKSFFSKEDKTLSEAIDYIRFMTLTQNVDPAIYNHIPPYIQEEIRAYIVDPMTATTFNDKQKNNNEVVTSELIYYWMTALNIPFECQKWHLNRLMTLIHVCNLKNTPAKKMSQKEVYAQHKLLNAQRRAKYGTGG